MNILLAAPEEIDHDRLVVEGRRADHLVKILGVKEGDTLRVGIVNGARGTARVESLQPKHPRKVELRVSLNDSTHIRPRIDLVLALPRPIMTRRILSQLTSLGTEHFYLIHAKRVEKSFWDASLLNEKSYSEHLRSGLEQAMDTILPKVSFYRKFKPFVEDILPQLRNQYSHALLAHPGDGLSLGEAIGKEADRILLIVGPEGGWLDYEIAQFIQQGCQPVTLGERILRVDTAAIALHARISQILEEKGCK